jgi:hypothetical protein
MWLSCGIFIHETAVGPQTHRASTQQAPGSSQKLLRVSTWSSLRRRLSLEEIGEIGAELAKLPPDRVPDRRDSAALSSGWAERVDERIADLSSSPRPDRVHRVGGASRSSGASAPTPATAPPRMVPGRAIGSRTAGRLSIRGRDARRSQIVWLMGCELGAKSDIYDAWIEEIGSAARSRSCSDACGKNHA